MQVDLRICVILENCSSHGNSSGFKFKAPVPCYIRLKGMHVGAKKLLSRHIGQGIRHLCFLQISQEMDAYYLANESLVFG